MASLPFKHPAGAVYALYEEIDVEDRGRVDYGDIAALKDSIKDYGLMHLPLAVPIDPPVNGKKWRLIAGGRRTAAMLAFSPSHIPLGIRRDIKDTGRMLEMELEENIQRKDMSWQEEASMIRRAHIHYSAVNAELGNRWGTKQTGRLFGKSAAHVGHALQVADLLNSGDNEIASAKSIRDAYSILLARKEREVDSIKAARLLNKKPIAPPSSPTPTSVPQPSISPMPTGTGMRALASVDVDAFINGDMSALGGRTDDLVKGNTTFFDGQTDFPLSQWCTLGNSVTTVMPSWPDGCVDHIITDPPYGIDINEEHLKNAGEIISTHNRDANLAMFPEMLRQFHRILRDRGYCIFFIDIEHIDYLKRLAREAGFTVQNAPFHWVKTHACKNLAATVNFTTCIEHALICRKGTASLQLAGPNNFICADGSIDRKMYSNPFAKPYAVWSHLITAVTRQGDIVADPFAGQMSCPRALLNLGRIPKAVEMEEHHYNKGISILSDMIKELAGKDVTFS